MHPRIAQNLSVFSSKRFVLSALLYYAHLAWLFLLLSFILSIILVVVSLHLICFVSREFNGLVLISSKDLIAFVFVDNFNSYAHVCAYEVSATRPIDRARAMSSDIFGQTYEVVINYL